MKLDENVFDEQMRGLLVARGGFLTEKRKEEILRYWYIEFGECDERAFIQTVGKLKFGGGSGNDSKGFPTFRDFRDLYNQIHKPLMAECIRGYCGFCNEGRVAFRGVNKKTNEVQEYIAGCSKCTAPNERGKFQMIGNPQNLHKDKIGQYRTLEALAIDRVPQEIKWPHFLEQRWKEKNPGKERKKEYFTGLHPMNDPDVEFVQMVPVQEKPKDGAGIARAVFGKSDPKNEEKRQKSLKRDRDEEEGFPRVPY